MPKRVQSPSCINTYKQCPRKYYYQYILKLPTFENIHLIRGKVVHSVLENFFKLDIKYISKENYEFEFRVIILSLFDQFWNKSKRALYKINLGKAELERYYNDSKVMLLNWHSMFMEKLKKEMKSLDLVQAFQKLIPITEQHFSSKKFMVRGYIDAIHEIGDNIHLIDYKTSKEAIIDEGYRLQLAIYALLYYEKYDKLPEKVGVCFLKHGEQFMDVDEDLLNFAKEECKLIQENTKSDKKEDYEKRESALCRWHSGQCDFYDECINRFI